MKSQHIKELNEWGFEIGNHGYTHSMLTELNDDELYHELFSSKIIIEQTTRTLVKSFSIPYGSYNDNVIGKIKYFGYTCCLNSDFKVNTGRADPFALTRMDPKLIPEE
jgi:peptidoglycan/xylan/chitin deacetylase (PgdA/CDA1 family)